MDKANIDIVFVRMDKIGDLVLSLPVDTHPALAKARVHWFITKGLGFVAEHAEPARSFNEFPRVFSLRTFVQMVKWFKQNRPRLVVLLHNPWWVSAAAWWAGVPERVGRLSQWHSFLFINLGLRQKRSLSDRHESDYNFDLLEWGLKKPSPELEITKRNYLRLNPGPTQGTLARHALTSGQYRVVHAGMAGSALNWPPARYHELIERLRGEMPVAITGTQMDRQYLQCLNDLRGKPGVVWLAEKLKVTELLEILANARSVVAPSTGVLHLAASLGTASIGIYSPRRVEHPRRWGPKGPRVAVVQPENESSEDVMLEISTDLVYQTIMRLEDHEQQHDVQSQPGV